MEKITIKEVAREAGVSIGTVSNALNGTRYIHPDTKEKVLAAVRKLNYTPNLNGRYLKTGESRAIGFFTNSIAGPFFSYLVDAMAGQCEKHGFELIVFITKDGMGIIDSIIGRGLAGVVIYEDRAIGSREVSMLELAGIKTVFIDREKAGDGIASVLFDSYQAGYEATRYLIRLGHQSIVFIECEGGVRDSDKRKEGWQKALSEYGLLEYVPAVLNGCFDEDASFCAVRNFLSTWKGPQPDAFLASNDVSAIGCIKALESRNVRVPEDVSVMGFDDIDIAQYYRPTLTTVKNPIRSQGITAIDTLVSLIKDEKKGTLTYLECRLVIRESCMRRV